MSQGKPQTRQRARLYGSHMRSMVAPTLGMCTTSKLRLTNCVDAPLRRLNPPTFYRSCLLCSRLQLSSIRDLLDHSRHLISTGQTSLFLSLCPSFYNKLQSSILRELRWHPIAAGQMPVSALWDSLSHQNQTLWSTSAIASTYYLTGLPPLICLLTRLLVYVVHTRCIGQT